jgi:hypothetical protein
MPAKVFAFFAKISLVTDYADLQSSCKSELLRSSLKLSARLGAFRRKSAGKSFPPNFAEVAERRRKKQKLSEFFSEFGCLSELNLGNTSAPTSSYHPLAGRLLQTS